jgi:mono/diheme cytochrome c family protein
MRMKIPALLLIGLLSAGLSAFLSGCAESKSNWTSFVTLATSATSSNQAVSEDASLSSVLLDANSSISEKQAFALAKLLNSPTWQKRWWIEKTARLLRGGEILGEGDDIPALMKMSEKKIVETFMSDPRFGDTALDFNMFFLGFKVDQIKSRSGVYKEPAFRYGSAVVSAKELLSDGDYFKLFDFYGPLFLGGYPDLSPDPDDPTDIGLTPTELRTKHLRRLHGALQTALDYLAEPGADKKGVCGKLQAYQFNAQDVLARFSRDLVDRVISFDQDGVLRKINERCYSDKPVAISEFPPLIEKAIVQNDLIVDEVLKFDPTIYKPASVTQFQIFDLARIEYQHPWLEIPFEMSRTLPNSSTNLDRKRAAYMLKHFFCDDLTPIGVENPAEHTGSGNPHGTDPSCFACHYKLDPMAGFFRDFGILMFDFGKEKYISFDDNVAVEREKYADNWRAPKGASVPWNIGYVRSTTKPELNSYGESLSDLSNLFRQAPEVRRCLSKRVFQYFVNNDQTIDAGYLNSLTEHFNIDAKKSTSFAMKELIERVVLSHSFAQGNLDPAKCYDYAPGEDPVKAPPCRVAFVFQNNCASCHASKTDKGNLDLTSWIRLPDGSMTFPHLDDHGNQISARDTLAMISYRLSTTDSEDRMPRKKDMSAQDRQELYLWAQTEWSKTKPVGHQ